jgi:BirA family transcriptional regulator, biotin operon repressor / biotin---[acetyl-CoA-carboxylase] ligase
MKVAHPPIKWLAESIWEDIAPILPGFTVEVLPEIDSTNSELMRRAKAGHIEPTLLIAEKQTAGRGRLGREWHDLAERAETVPALTFSLGLPLSPVDWSGLSLAVGVSVAQSLHPGIKLKWPNDLWLNDRKLAGILIETCAVGAQRYVIIGVGINIAEPSMNQTSLVESLRTAPAWLQEVLPEITSSEALKLVTLTLVQNILVFADYGFTPFLKRFNALDLLRDREVSFNKAHAPYEVALEATSHHQGKAVGANEKGELLVQTAQGLQAINSAEVSVRPL